MNRLFLFISVFVVLLSGCVKQKSNSFVIDGSIDIDSLNGKWVYLVPSFQEMEMVIDSALIEKKRFKMEGDVGFESYIALLIVTDDKRNIVSPLVGANIVVEPGVIEVNFNSDREPTISGTPQNMLIQRCDDSMSRFNEECQTISKSDVKQDKKIKKLFAAREKRNAELLSVMERFINSEQVQALFLEYYTFFSKEELESIERNMNETTRMNQHIQFALSTKGIAVGQPYIDFQLCSLDGAMVNLSDVVVSHDFVYVDFWASWCAPCVREMKQLSAYYPRRDPAAFEVVGVSLDSDPIKWENACLEYDFKWLQLNEPISWASPIVSKYGVNYLPNSVLIDKSGIIMSKNPRIEELQIVMGI